MGPVSWIYHEFISISIVIKDVNHRQPTLPRTILRRFLRPELLEEVQGDMDENYYSRLHTTTKRKADLNYWYQTFNYLRPFALHMGFWKLLSILIVPLALVLVLVPYSLILGWNIVTLLIFWFIIIPAIAIHTPSLILKYKRHPYESVLGLVIFYLFMAFMIYEHFHSDFFKVMTVSCLLNLLLVSAIIRLLNPQKNYNKH